MKWPQGQLEPLMSSTLKVIFNVPNSTYVEKYLKRWKKHRECVLKVSSASEAEAFSFYFMKLNKEIQCEWFQGTCLIDPSVPLMYRDKYKSTLNNNSY